MKKALILSIALLGTMPLLAQKGFILSHLDKRGYLNLSGGLSMPTGSVLKGDPTAPSDLMAFRGSSFQLAIGYRIGYHWGAVLSMTNCINDGNARPLVDNLEKSQLGTGWTDRAGTWNCSHLLAGPSYTINAGRWIIDTRIMGGYSWIARPYTELSGKYYQLEMGISTSSSKSKSFTAGLGTSVRFKVGRNIALAVHADYLTTRAKFDNIEATVTMGPNQSIEPVREVKPMGILSLSGGLSLLF